MIGLLFLQLLVFNNIQFSGYVNPYVYILFIILLPFEIKGWFMLLLSFLYGLILDLMIGTPGLHAASTVFLGFMREKVLGLFSPRDGYPVNSSPSIKDFGFNWFFKYSALLIILHHLVLFYLEAYTLSGFFATLGRIIISSIFTWIFALILHFTIIRR